MREQLEITILTYSDHDNEISKNINEFLEGDSSHPYLLGEQATKFEIRRKCIHGRINFSLKKQAIVRHRELPVTRWDFIKEMNSRLKCNFLRNQEKCMLFMNIPFVY